MAGKSTVIAVSEPKKITLETAPVGTQAPSASGGAWCKVGQGRWKWSGPFGTGGVFLRPGADWDGRLMVPLAKLPKRAQQLLKDAQL